MRPRPRRCNVCEREGFGRRTYGRACGWQCGRVSVKLSQARQGLLRGLRAVPLGSCEDTTLRLILRLEPDASGTAPTRVRHSCSPPNPIRPLLLEPRRQSCAIPSLPTKLPRYTACPHLPAITRRLKSQARRPRACIVKTPASGPSKAKPDVAAPGVLGRRDRDAAGEGLCRPRPRLRNEACVSAHRPIWARRWGRSARRGCSACGTPLKSQGVASSLGSPLISYTDGTGQVTQHKGGQKSWANGLRFSLAAARAPEYFHVDARGLGVRGGRAHSCYLGASPEYFCSVAGFRRPFIRHRQSFQFSAIHPPANAGAI